VELDELKKNWNEILFALEAKNRVAWLTFFDARLASLNGDKLRLDFSDSEKFSGNHSYTDARAKFSKLLVETINEKTGQLLEITW
jgi:hypothetical protein